jgi:integrase/recombinase XerC
MDNQEALRRFEAYLQRRYPDRRTPVDYVCDVRQFQRACPKPWDTVTVKDMDAFVNQMHDADLKPTTIKRRVAALKVYFDFVAVEDGQPNHPNPVHPKRHAGKLGRRLPRGLFDEQVTRLLAALKTERDRALVALMLRGGLRVSEVVGLKLADLWLPVLPGAPARLRVLGKGQKERMALVSAQATDELRAWLAVRPPVDSAALFLNEHGQPLSVAGVQRLLRGYGEQVGIDLSPHRLRHTFARQLVEAEMPVESLSRLLGHAQVSTTQIYLEGADPNLRRTFIQTMERIETGAHPQTPTPGPCPAPGSPPPATVGTIRAAEPRYPDPPDDSTWATDLPEAIRQACLAYVQRHLSGWRPSQRRERALHVLGDFARFWRWAVARQPLKAVTELQAADLEAYIGERIARGDKPRTVKDALDRVFGLLHELAEEDKPVSPGLFRVQRPRLPDPLPRALSEAEYQRLEAQGRRWLEQDSPEAARDAAWFFLLAHGGLRICELLDLRQGDVDLGRRSVHVQGKGSRDRVVYLTETAAQALQRYLTLCPHPEQALLFVNTQSGPLAAPWLREQLRALGEAAQVAQVTPHRLRHTLATRLVNAGMAITALRKLLGHDHLSTTQIYTHMYDTTVEHDYRQAMTHLEQATAQQNAIAVPAGWLVPAQPSTTVRALDNSV